MKKLIISIGIVLFVAPLYANPRSSETIEARKGLFRLLSADMNESSEYSIRTSIQYFQDNGLLNDGSRTKGAEAMIGLGYAFNPYLYFSGQGGMDITNYRDGQLDQNYNLAKFGLAATGTYDIGKNFFKLPDYRFTAGLSLWVDFSKITRFFKGPHVVPTLILSSDFSDMPRVPFRLHGNAGFRWKNSKRYFDEDAQVTDFDRVGTHTTDFHTISAAIGVEFPFQIVNPSVEFHWEIMNSISIMQEPKWVTVGLKAKPFPQKNIELFSAVDLGLSTYEATPINERARYYDTPLWNVIIGFGLTQFGKRAGEIGVNAQEFNRTLEELREKNNTLEALKRDLSYNTIRGRVIDSETKEGLGGVHISFPEQQQLKASTTSNDGSFTRYFPYFEGGRVQFSKEGYEPSTKFLALKPGESVNVTVELVKGAGRSFGDFVVTVTDENANPIQATITALNLKTNEETKAVTDESGKLTFRLPEGEYSLEIRAKGFLPKRDRFDIQRGKAVLRTYTVTRF